MTEEMTVEDWLAIRKEEGLKIDPSTAEVMWIWGQIADPYGIRPELTEEWCVGGLCFARRPGSDVWVEFGDLPDETRDALRRREKGPKISLVQNR
jgi:hypothetical protein